MSHKLYRSIAILVFCGVNFLGLDLIALTQTVQESSSANTNLRQGIFVSSGGSATSDHYKVRDAAGLPAFGVMKSTSFHLGPLTHVEEFSKENDYIPKSFKLYQNYPNPFNQSTTIQLDMPITENIEISIYNVIGEKVCALYHKELPAGVHTWHWYGRNNNGYDLATGLYFCEIKSDSFYDLIKILLVR